MRWKIMTMLVLLIIFFTIFSSQQFHNQTALSAVNREGLTESLNQLVNNDPNLKGAIAGISIREGKTGEIIYNHLGDVRLHPASNMKLLTAAAALSTLGKDYRFTTELLTDGNVKNGVIEGNLYLKGKGAPTLLPGDFDKLAQELKNRGIKKINGDLLGDDSWFDDERYSVDLTWTDEWTYYGAQVSALTAAPNQDYDAGTVIVEVFPGKEIGQPALVKLHPKTDYIKIVNHAVTGSPDGSKKITIEREHGKNMVMITGNIPMKATPEKEWIAVWEPTGYALDLFGKSLNRAGVIHSGSTKSGIAPKNASLMVSKKSIPISELLIPFMKLSNNGHAEVLVKEMGKTIMGEGSWEKGLEVMKTELKRLGVNPDTLVIRDGSGISHVNLIPANEISRLLFAIQDESWFPEFIQSLPVAGMGDKMVGGTLRKRMKAAPLRGKVRAKTGTIATVSSLSGYVETKSGETLVFSILLNNLLDEEKGKATEDKFLSVLGNQ